MKAGLGARWFGRELRRAREVARVNQPSAAASLGIDAGSMSKIENGLKPVNSGRFDVLLDLCRVNDPVKRRALARLGEDAWAKGWWDDYIEHFSREHVDRAWLEAHASVIRCFGALLLPELVRTREYAEAVIRAVDPTVSAERVRVRLDFDGRRRQLLETRDAPEICVIVDEAQLHRPIGGPDVMRAQLAHLLDLAHRPDMTVVVQPFTAGAHSALTGAFELYELPAYWMTIASTETVAGTSYTDSTSVEAFIGAHARLRETVLPAEQSATLIQTAMKQH